MLGKRLIFDRKGSLAESSFDLPTSGLWAQHASTAPLCFLRQSELKGQLIFVLIHWHQKDCFLT